MNKAFFRDITIENFKSLHAAQLTDCKRINVFIDKPALRLGRRYLATHYFL